MTSVQPTVFDGTVTVGWANYASTCNTQSFPSSGWDPPVLPPPLPEQLVDAFCRLHNAAVSLKEAWS